MKLHSLLIVAGIGAALAMAGPALAAPSLTIDQGFVTNSPSNHLIISAGALADPMTVTDLSGKHIDLTYVGTDSAKLVAVNDAIDDAWYALGSKLQAAKNITPLVKAHDVGLGIGAVPYHVIQVLPSILGDIAMLKNDDVCKASADSGGMLATSAGSGDIGALALGTVFGPAHGWASGARSVGSSCGIGSNSSASAVG